MLSRVFEYWKNVDPDLGKTIEERTRQPQRQQRPVTYLAGPLAN